MRTPMTMVFYETRFPNGIYCPYGKVVCHPKVTINLWPIDHKEPIPFKMLDKGLEGITVATFEEASHLIAKKLAQWCYCNVAVKVEEGGFGAVTTLPYEPDRPMAWHDEVVFEDGSGSICKVCGRTERFQ